MSARLGTSLPMIFVRGQPAILHNMTLDQLRKFVPFLVKSVTKKDLPNSIDGQADNPPSWWPKDLEFSKAVLHAKLSNKEQVKRLVKAVSTCYSQFHLTYLIAFSSSLATKNGSKEFGKLTYQELTNGTTRILNGQGQLVVVIRTATRYYDRIQKMTDERESRRRSARLQLAELNGEDQKNEGPASSAPSTSPKFQKIICKNLAVRLEDCDPKGVKKRNVPLPRVILNRHSVGSTRPSTSQRSSSPKVTAVQPVKRGIKRKKGAVYTPECFICKECNRTFEFSDLLSEHQANCLKSKRENESIEKSNFLAMMGLISTASLPLPSAKVVEQPYVIAPVVSSAKGRPKRACQKQFSRTELGKFVKNQPILPLTSDRGKKLLQAHNAWSLSGPTVKPLQNPSNEAYKYLNSKSTKAPRCPEPQVVTMKKHKIGDDQYAHKYSYTGVERKIRRVELELGISTSSFQLYNKCRPCTVGVKRLSQKIVDHHLKLQAKKKANRRAAQMKLLKKAVVPLKDVLDDLSNVPSEYHKILIAYMPYRFFR